MKSLKSTVRRAEKKKAITKDFQKRKRINANVPSVTEVVKEDRMKQKTKYDRPVFQFGVNQKGQKIRQPVMELAGTKEVVVKSKKYKLHVGENASEPRRQNVGGESRIAGMIEYPASKKFRGKKLKTNNK